jgi:uncharacterized protein YunC (DUF1805 family)
MVAGTEKDIINTMLMAASEIKELRKSNQILSSQVHIVEIFAAALGFKQNGMVASEDIAWRLEKHVEAIKEDLKRKAPPTVLDNP